MTEAWLVLVLSGVLEAVWATALARSEGFTKPLPLLVFSMAALARFVGVAQAMRTLPVRHGRRGLRRIGAALTARLPRANRFLSNLGRPYRIRCSPCPRPPSAEWLRCSSLPT